jgi:hypothetical protein
MANINGHDVDQREHEHPYEINEVPVETTDFDVFVFQFVHAGRDYAQVDRASRDVKHVQPGDGKKGGAK